MYLKYIGNYLQAVAKSYVNCKSMKSDRYHVIIITSLFCSIPMISYFFSVKLVSYDTKF